MRLDDVNPQDIVLVDKRGRRIYAVVVGVRAGVVEIQPLGRDTWREATAREVVRHWSLTHHARGHAQAEPTARERAQLSFDDLAG